MQYLELTFHINPYNEAAADVLAALLADAGCDTFEPSDTGLTAYILQDAYDNKLLPNDFDDIFTRNKPIVINFHGYQETIRSIFSHYANPIRLSIHGYEDQGSTTSPLDELARNHCSRYDIAADILERTGHYGHTHKFETAIIENARHANQTGLDK